MENKTETIKDQTEQVLEQSFGIIGKLNNSISELDFGQSLSESSLDKLKLHLGYTKTFSDLAKTRVLYTRVMEYEGGNALNPSDKKLDARSSSVGTPKINTRVVSTGRRESVEQDSE